MRLASLVLLLVAFVAEATAAAPARAASPWLPVESDLPTDPTLRDGVLPNGLRYLLLPNTQPKDNVSFRLVVGAGSLHENDDERGLAHFVEHMAFRGTRDFPDGKMAETLQRLGIAFGPDSTAFTSHVHTIYHLEVPTRQPATVRLALHALREYAAGVTFDPRLIERERGVVLAEMATRDTPEARAADYNLQLLWPQSREARRKVIGEADQIRGFQRNQFQAFYDAWYRPERMAVIAVGDFDPGEMQRLVETEFGPLAPRGDPRPEPADLLTPETAKPTVGLFREPGVIGLYVALEKATRSPRVPDTQDHRAKKLRQALAFAMFELRLHKQANATGAQFVGPNASLTAGLRDWEVATVGLNGRLVDWQDLLGHLEREHRTALQFGFTAAELTEARAAAKTHLEQARRSAATRGSPLLAHQLVGTLINGTVFATPEALERDLVPKLDRITLAETRAAFRAAWQPGSPTVFVAANDSFDLAASRIAEVMNASRASPVTRPASVEGVGFAYPDFGPAGELVKEERLADLDARLTEFANGVKLNFKSTAYDADQVVVRIRVGDGKLSQLKTRPGLDLLANGGFAAGGVGRHTQQELSDLLVGRAVSLSFHVDYDALVFSARCAPRELKFALQVITAFISDPGFRPEAMRHARAHYGSVMAQLMASPSGPIMQGALRHLFSDDGRFGVATYDEFSGRDLAELRAWMEPQLTTGPIELSVVGEIDWPAARSAVADTLGALPRRQPVTDRTAPVPVVVAPVPGELRAFPIPPTLKQVTIAWYWPVEETAGTRQERRSHLLASIIAERLRARTREELGATYAASAFFQRIDGFPGANAFVCHLDVDPQLASQVLTLLERELRSLSAKGPTADEFERAKQPYVRGMTEDLRTNAYWGGTVLGDAQQRPQRIEAARNRTADVAAITRAEVAALARRYLDPKRAFKFVTVPVKK